VAQGKTMVMVTHNKELAAQVPRVIEIVNGRISRDENGNGKETYRLNGHQKVEVPQWA